MPEGKPMTKVLVFGGKTGWIGGKMHDLCKEKGASLLLLFGLLLALEKHRRKDISAVKRRGFPITCRYIYIYISGEFLVNL